MTLFEHRPHPHVQARKAAGPPTVGDARKAIHGAGAIGRVNAAIGLRITMIVGTMWTAYLFTMLALISAPSAFTSGNPIIIVAWVAQTLLQLVLLPIIIVGQSVQAAAADKRAEATYADAECVLHECLELQRHLAAQDTLLARMHRAVVGGPIPGADDETPR